MMPKGTLQIAYNKLLLENLELKERIEVLEAKNRNLRMDVKLWKNRTTEAAKAVEDFEELETHLENIERLGRDYISISEEVLKDQMVNVELGYKFRKMKDIFEQALKGK